MEDRREHEAASLRIIGRRGRFILRGIHASPLEPPCGGESAFVAAVERLASSALTYASIEPQSQDRTTLARLRQADELVERVQNFFRPLRTVIPPLRFDPTAGLWDSTQRWEFEMYPPRVHRAVKHLFFALDSTSREVVDEDLPIPLRFLALRGFTASPPLSDEHVAAVAGLVCIARAIYAWADVLNSWRYEFERLAAHLDFAGHIESEPWEEVMHRVRLDPGVRQFEFERKGDAVAWLAKASAWLDHAEGMLEADAMADRAVTKANAKVKADERLWRVKGGRERHEPKRSTAGETLNAELVAERMKAHGGKLTKALRRELWNEFKASDSALFRLRTEALGKKPLP